MPKTLCWMLFAALACVTEALGQQVVVVGDANPEAVPPPAKKAQPLNPHSLDQPSSAKTEIATTAQPVKFAGSPAPDTAKPPALSEKAKGEPDPHLVTVAKMSASAGAAAHPSPTKPAVATATASPKPAKVAGTLPSPATMRLTRVEGPPPEHQPQLPLTPRESESLLRTPGESAFVRLVDGFDFPIGKPDAQGYYKARGFRSHGHLGEDWDGIRGGDTDLRDPIYCIGNGIVVFARDCHMGWGNVVIVRHSYRDGGAVKSIDSLYAHLDRILVHRGQLVSRGQQIATMGNAHGLYDAHLHLEIRKNIEIGMSRAKFAQDFSNYYDPTQFINQHRHLQGGGASYRVAMNTFVHDSRINWAAVRNYSHSRYRGGTRQSATALKEAVAKKN